MLWCTFEEKKKDLGIISPGRLSFDGMMMMCVAARKVTFQFLGFKLLSS